MGTRFELVLAGEDPERHRGAAEAALEEVEACHRRFTRFEPSGLLAHLQRVAGPVALDAATFALFDDALAVWRDSAGAFDLTVPACRMRDILLDYSRGTVRLAHPDLPLDFGAIAKGHALDLAAQVLRESGVTSAFLHGGTSSAVALGAPPGEPGWRVAIGPEPGAPILTLADEAMSVSAVWEGNPHPTFDPRTGAPVSGPRRVVVTGPSARQADAWSTAILVLGHRPASLGPAWSILISCDANPCLLDATS